MSKDPLKTSVSEGLAKMHEASEFIPEETVEELAEKARKDAEESKQQHRNKHAE
ncbi:TPA: hypothetical protein QHP67_002135 [Klebsiella pneumoniae subsp. pneumoniae]|nr:hypothetical protein [Klebsiella pneumoniae subsp. pneumoniae]